MISVCVPVFNTDVRKLGLQLVDLSAKTSVPIEILLFDDCSDEKFQLLNRETATYSGIIYKEMESNLGRAAIRNRLGNSATQPWLLFLDGDSSIETTDFLSRYLEAIPMGEVICGGTSYPAHSPEYQETLLRWVYGRKREQLSALQRKLRNNFAITANNFLINREVFLQHGFRENIRGYGHEDTVLGYDLFKAGIRISHIDNPVLHTGLESSAEYLEKTKKAIENLLFIHANLIPDPEFRKESGLLKIGFTLRKAGLLRITATLFRWIEPCLRKNLTGTCPKLFLFNLYRIGYMCGNSSRRERD